MSSAENAPPKGLLNRLKDLGAKWAEGRVISTWDSVVNSVVSYILGILSLAMFQQVTASPLKYQDAFVTAENGSGRAPIAARIDPLLSEVRRQANEEGFALDTPFGPALSVAYCRAFRPGRTDPVKAMHRFQDQFAGCLTVSQSSGTDFTRLSIEPGPSMSEPQPFFRPDDGSLSRIGFCGCDGDQQKAFLDRNARFFGPPQ